MTNVHVTIEAPDWCFDGGFPEDMPYTDRADLPEGSECVEPYVVDACTYKECEIRHFEGLFFKVELSKEGKI